jgi:exo-beta-1,3-glucanase (GH17 family)
MRAFLQGWSPLIAALLVVISVIYTGGKNTQSVQERLAILEKNMDSIRNAIEGNQGIDVRLAALDLHVNEKLQNLIIQREDYIECNEFDVFNTQDAFFTLKNTVDTIFNMTQRIEFVEEMLLDMQAGIEDIRKQQNKGN